MSTTIWGVGTFESEIFTSDTVNNSIVSGTDDPDYISNDSGSNVTVYGLGGVDYIQNTHNASNIVLYGGDGNDSIITNYSEKAYGDAGNDYIQGGGYGSYYPYLDGGAGNDTVEISGQGTAVGGAGDDFLNCMNADKLTIIGGTGDDTILLQTAGHDGAVIQYSDGDGNDDVNGFLLDRDTLQIAAETYTTSTTRSAWGNKTYSGTNGVYKIDCVVHVGSGSITLHDIATIGETFTMNVVGAQDVTPADTSTETVPANTSTETVPANTSTETVPANTSTETVPADTSTETVPADTSTETVPASTSSYSYSGGSQTISNYSGEKINYAADFTGIGFSDTDFMLNSSTGSLTIQNARDKVIDVAVNDQTVAYAYMASGGGQIDGSSFSQLEVILGGNNADNNILAGSGGSSLWGGVGGSDIFTGGAGVDEIFFGKNDGADKIFNSASSDVINLYDVTLADIISAGASSDMISVGLNTGGSLEIYSAENLSATFKLADNSAWQFNHSSGGWQTA